MSDILIKGMEMPTSCISCLLNFGEKRPEYGLTIYCPYSDGVISWRDKAFDNGRLASCGIVSVPKHGRCIDVDALIKSDRMVGKMMMFGGEYVYTQAEIDRAPTILPAEEEE